MHSSDTVKMCRSSSRSSWVGLGIKPGGMIPDRYYTILGGMIPWAVWTAGIIWYQTTQKPSEILIYHCLTPCKGSEDSSPKRGLGSNCIFCSSFGPHGRGNGKHFLNWAHNFTPVRVAYGLIFAIASKVATWYYSNIAFRSFCVVLNPDTYIHHT